MTIFQSLPTLLECCLHPQTGHLLLSLIVRVLLHWLCPPPTPTVALEHRSSQPTAMLPIYKQAPSPIPALTPLSLCSGVMEGEAIATSLSAALPTLLHSISSYLSCIASECLCFPPLSLRAFLIACRNCSPVSAFLWLSLYRQQALLKMMVRSWHCSGLCVLISDTLSPAGWTRHKNTAILKQNTLLLKNNLINK